MNNNEKMLENYSMQINSIGKVCNAVMKNISDKLKVEDMKILYDNKEIKNFLESVELKNKIEVMKNFEWEIYMKRIEEITRQSIFLYESNITRKMIDSITIAMYQISKVQKNFIDMLMKSTSVNISPIFKTLSISIEEINNNPDSLLNWMKYYDKMSKFFWIMPYKISTEELREILQNVATEKEFDLYISKYFNKNKVNTMIEDIKNMLTNKNQKRLFNQIILAYESRSYALASIGIITMIDNFLSFYLIDKGCTSRVKLFEPIIKDLELKIKKSNFLFIVMMVNSNINLLYEQIEFNSRISIKTNKKSRRNPIAHGKSYSYKKIDTIMLFNTMYYLLIIQRKLIKYKNSLYRNSRKKEFYILDKGEKEKIRAKIQNKSNKVY